MKNDNNVLYDALNDKSLTKFKPLLLRLFDYLVIAFSFMVGELGLLAIVSSIPSIDPVDFWSMKDLICFGIIFALFVILGESFGLYKTIWRFSTVIDYIKIIVVGLLNAVLAFVVCLFVFSKNRHYIDPNDIPRKLVFLSVFTGIFASFICLLTKFVYKVIMTYRGNSGYRRAVVLGAGEAGSLFVSSLTNEVQRKYKIFAFFDDDESKIGQTINNIPVKGKIEDMPAYCRLKGIQDIIITIPSASSEQMRRIVDIAGKADCQIKILPSSTEIIEGDTWKQIKDFEMEDLLGRTPIDLTDPKIRNFIRDKVVMVTGGGGSIGSELCRQIAMNCPKQLIILDYYENNAYDIQQELIDKYEDKLNLVVEICNVRERDKVDYVFNEYKPQVVFHAAAHKHVPLMEHNPEEAIKNNVFGTYNVASCALKYGVDRFTLISTDKAVNPTNVMGATKRLCEMIVQSMNGQGKTQFVAVRFGNVLGSNGSVFHIFKRQIEAGGPVKVTHPDIVRFFMTIKEAVSLVLTATAIAEQGCVFVLDMGAEMKIIDFANTLISYLSPNKPIPVVFTGLRPGEKLYEEKLVNKDKEKTSHNKIFIEPLQAVTKETIDKALAEFKDALAAEDPEKVKDVVKKYVPSYKAPEKIGKQSLEGFVATDEKKQ